ncbi:hypothetical protein FRC09_004647 [Ceratobasidium sp. 395]|nr:hypothetical protein FRC09_004647 [Ceratobasidium sp. 395]
MSNLVELTGSLTILKKENLLVISSLPALHRLAILGIYGPDVLEPEGLSMDSFPALRELRLAGLVTYDQVSVLGILPIMRHLTHLELECSIDYDDADEGNPDDEWIASELLPQLGNSPELLCLVLKFKHSRQNYIPCDIRGIALTEIFPKLPLEQVILEGACVYSWEYLTEAWANVSSIRISDQCVGMEELEVLTQLPRLQYLRMCLDLAGVGGWVARLETSQSPLHILESSKPGAIGVEPEELEDTAEVLLKLFPNLQELVWTRGSEAERAFVEILNQHIVLKREIEEMKMKIGVMRLGFKVSGAFVWSRLDGVQHLLSLLGTAQNATTKGSLKTTNIAQTIGTASSADVNFSRFDIYATFVRRVRVYGTTNCKIYCEAEVWEHLTLRAQRRPLLPNLLSLVLQASDDIREHGQLFWIRLFSSPSLRILQVIPNSIDSPLLISRVAASVILDVVAVRCPRLLKLSLLPGRIKDSERAQQDSGMFGLLWKRPYQEYFRALPNLIELTCTTVLFEQGTLPIIGSLPQLHQITVMDSGARTNFHAKTLSRESFPALRKLHVKGVPLSETTTILGIPSLMRHLTHILLSFVLEYDSEDEESEDEESRSMVNNLLSCLSNAPSLACLDLDLDPNKSDYGPLNIGNEKTMNTFSRLPLETVSLTGLHLGDWADKGNLAAIWPNLTSLRMRDQVASPRILYKFSQIPRIRDLMLQVWIYDLEEAQAVELLPRCPLRTLEFSPRSLINYQPSLLKPMGSLREIVWPKDKGDDTPDYLAQQRFIGFLNLHIKLMREWNELKAKSRC